MRRGFSCLVLIALLPGLVQAGFTARSAGNKTAAFLKIAPGGRQVALGETGASLIDGANNIFWNPALLGVVRHRSLSFNHSTQLTNITHSYVSLGIPIQKERGFGMGINLLDVGSIDEINDVGAKVGSFKPQDVALSVGAGWPIGPIRLGVVGKYVSMKIKEQAATFTGDMGLLFPLRGNKTVLSLTGRNLFGQLKFNDRQEELPKQTRLGLSQKIHPAFLFLFEIQGDEDQTYSYATGVEAKFHIGAKSFGFTRIGFNQGIARDKEDLSGLSLGLGLKWMGSRFDYAWVPLGDLGQTHTFTLSVSFGTKAKAQDPETHHLPTTRPRKGE